jgi:hypothetical protein
MLLRLGYHLCLFFFGAFALASIYGYFHCNCPEFALAVDDREQNFPGLLVDREYSIDYRLHNRGSQPLRVVGAEWT